MIQVLYVGSEFCSATSLVKALPKHLVEAGVKLDIIVPHLNGIDKNSGQLAERLTRCNFDISGESISVRVFEGRRDGHIRSFYLDHPQINAAAPGLDSDANIRSMSLFSHAVSVWLSLSATRYDVVHCDGIATCLIPVLMRTRFSCEPRISDIKVVQFVKGIEDKGSVDMRWSRGLGLIDALCLPEGMEFYGKLSILKGAYLYADAVVLPNDKLFMRLEEGRKKQDIGMEGVLFNRKTLIENVELGLELNDYNPQSGLDIVAPYDALHMENKAKAKAALIHSCQLRKEGKRATVSFIGNLDANSGVDLINDILDDLMDRNVNLILCGNGKDEYVSAIKDWVDEFKGSIALINEKPTPKRVREIVAGSDILLVASSNEQLDLLHLKAMRYGCVVVGRSQGALAGNIINVDNLDVIDDQANGFVFDGYDSDAFFNATMDALDVYLNSANWAALRKQAMISVKNMAHTAKLFVKLYTSLKA